jgi:hypothetical protein
MTRVKSLAKVRGETSTAKRKITLRDGSFERVRELEARSKKQEARDMYSNIGA